ncbi:putative efflux pump antibiotic resistance protein [Nemania sp. FL0916]|nr:putative efflux pump antibiotic resistance protein [Nemania sp. FL0916]
MDESTPLLLQNQSHSLPQKKLLIIFPALALIQFTSFLDQTAISTSLPAIASALGTGASISLVGASFLITSTSIQLINGRLSDIIGRKASLATALLVMGIGNLLCGLSATPVELFAARAFTGFGAGAINALVQIAIADITTLEQRGYYFGMVGMAVAFGNGLGPVVGGVLTQTLGWQWAFCSISICTEYAILDKLKLVDWVGAIASLLGIALLLIPISQGGSTLPWESPTTISMLLAGGVLLVFFVNYEWKCAKLPLLPARLFCYGFSTNILIFINILIGWVFWGNLFILPLYLQNVRGMTPAKAGTLMLPMVITHGLTSGITGIVISALGHYKPIIVTGAVCWTVAAFAKMHYNQTTRLWEIIVVGIFDGIGVGCSLQPVLVGLFAGSDSDDRAVLTGLRNFLRDMGGATGTTVSGAILANVLSVQLSSRFGPDLIAKLTSSAFALNDLDLSEEDKVVISQTYMRGLHAVFISFAILVLIHLCSCMFIRDYGLRRSSGQQQRQSISEERERRVGGAEEEDA